MNYKAAYEKWTINHEISEKVWDISDIRQVISLKPFIFIIEKNIYLDEENHCFTVESGYNKHSNKHQNLVALEVFL